MEFKEMKWNIIRYAFNGGKDLQTADTSLTWSLPTTWGGDAGYLIGIHGRVSVAFSGIAGPVYMEMGTSTSDTNNIMPRQNLNAARDLVIMPPPYLDVADTQWAFCNRTVNTRYNLTSPTIKFISDSGNLEDLTAGRVEIVIVSIVPA